VAQDAQPDPTAAVEAARAADALRRAEANAAAHRAALETARAALEAEQQRLAEEVAQTQATAVREAAARAEAAAKAPARAIEAAMSAGDFATASRRVDELLAQRGLQRQVQIGPTPDEPIVVSDVGLELTTHSGKPVIAAAFRGWDGHIQLSTQTAKMLRAFVSDPLVVAEREAKMRALDAEMAALRAKYPRTKPRAVKAQLATLYADREIAMRSFLDAKWAQDAPNTLVHETLHGFSPIVPAAYQGVAGQIEELTTETVARFTVRDLFGTAVAPPGVGSYGGDIAAAVNAVTETTGASAETAYDSVHRAAIRFKQRKAKLADVDAVVRAFAEDVAATSGADSSIIESVLRQHLSKTESAR
jgi:hypothetical protein